MVPQRAAAWVGPLASLVPVLSGLVASAALWVDSLRVRPVFCALEGGCDAVRHTAFASPLGVPLPVAGLIGFLALGVLAILPGSRVRTAQLGLSFGAGLLGAMLLSAQSRMGTWCPYCCVADASGVASGVVAVGRALLIPDVPAPRGLRLGAAAAMVGAVIAPFCASVPMTHVPEAIRDEIVRTPKGTVTVVDFVDFECPYCRMTHAAVGPMLQAHKDRVRVVRLQVPLGSHPHAQDAARAACCGERLGKGGEMADALFAAPVDALTREGCEAIAARVGLPLDAYRECVADPLTNAQIDHDRAEFKAAGGFALPTLWFDDREIVGAQPQDVLAKALGDALMHAGS